MSSHGQIAGRRSVRGLWWLLGLAALLVLAFVGRLLVGDSPEWSGKLSWPSPFLFELRLKIAFMACFVGMALGGSGVALQALLRNPLAEPFILGLSSGAALGVVGQQFAAHHLGLVPGHIHVAAVAGAAATMVVVFFASRRRGMIDPLGLLLTGVVLAMINGALVMLLRHFLPLNLRDEISRWMMGYINELLPWLPLIAVGVVTLIGLVLVYLLGRAMDVASFSDSEAMSLGVNLKLLRLVLFLVASVLAGASVMLAGPIAFVGLVCPHLARLMLGPRHRPLLVGSALLGGALMILADSGTRLLNFGQGWMPLGVFTALFGGPIFLWMLRGQLGRMDD